MIKKKMLKVCLFIMIMFNMYGCGSVSNSKLRPSDEELEQADTVCGVVRSVDDENIRIQLCGNIFWGCVGAGYLNVENEYEALKEGDCVLLYYTGELKCEEKGTFVELYNMEVCYIEKYENDGSFVAKMNLGGGMLEEGATKSEAVRYLIPVSGEPEEKFKVVISVTDLETDVTIWSDIVYEVEDWQKEVVVTYDLDTMEVISITQ